MKDIINDVYNFQTKVLNNEFPDRPTKMEGSHKDETVEKLLEEIQELVESDKLSDQADALIDLIYFALGALHQAGVDTEHVWNSVHHANMTKVRGKTKRGHDNDATKPEDWTPPDHTWLDEV